MVNRLRTGWLAGSGALLLVLALSGGVLGASLATDTTPVDDVTAPVETTATFEDLDGNGVDDDCDEAVIENAEAAAAAFAAADLDGDGTISTTEAARSGWTGGVNCNHGGFVSNVATTDDETDAEDDTDQAEEAAEEGACEAVPAPEADPELDPTASNAHGLWVSSVAHSEATGGKNCNHGGAVSEAAKKDQDAARAERDAAKAEREAARQLRAEERAAAKAARAAGQEKTKGKNR